MNVNIGGGRDSFTHVTHNSVFGKLCNSIGGVFIGIALFIAGFPLLAWNENNFIRVYESLAEGLQKVQSVHDINYIDPSMQGELVHVAGPLSNVPTLEDSEMGLAVQGTLLERVVEMYQWVEKSHKRKSNKRTITTYTYEMEWVDHIVDSSRFHHDGYDNPRDMPIESYMQEARDVKLGAFDLKASQVHQIGHTMSVPLNPETLRLKDASSSKRSKSGKRRAKGSLPDPARDEDPYGDDGIDYDSSEDPHDRAPARRSSKSRKGGRRAARGGPPSRTAGMVPAAPGARDMVLRGNSLYLAANPSRPQWGDVRVSWRAKNPHAATVIAVQSGSKLRPYKASNGYSVHLVMEGELSAEEAFEEAHSENTMFTWMLRAGGYLLMAIGLRMVLEPAVVAPQLIPLIGGFVSSIVACGACMASMSVAMVFTLVTVAIAWFAVRPTLSITLLCIAGATALFASLFRGKKGNLATPKAD